LRVRVDDAGAARFREWVVEPGSVAAKGDD
jgi:hypothetical protein